MKAKAFAIEEIHNSLVNGQRKQMVDQIDEYMLYDFWEDYRDYLNDLYTDTGPMEYFQDAVISYHRIKNR